MTRIKNINKAEVMALKEQVEYQDGQVVSKTLAQNEHVSVTLFSFDKGEEIGTHESGGDAFVTCLDGVGTVSYTHLDVYKRQICSPGILCSRSRRLRKKAYSIKSTTGWGGCTKSCRKIKTTSQRNGLTCKS